MLKRIGFLAGLCLAALMLAGCGILSSQLDKAAEAAGKAVSFYCENVTLPEVREEFRAAVNAKAAPHAINVSCATGGPALQTTTALEGFNDEHSIESGGGSPRHSSNGYPVEIPPQVAGASSGGPDVYLGRSGKGSTGSPGVCAPVGTGAGEGSPRPQECGAGPATAGGSGAREGRAEFAGLNQSDVI